MRHSAQFSAIVAQVLQERGITTLKDVANTLKRLRALKSYDLAYTEWPAVGDELTRKRIAFLVDSLGKESDDHTDGS